MRPRARGADILVVGDNPDLRHGLTFLLEKQGHAVATAAHAAQALGYLRQHRQPRLILLALALSLPEGWHCSRRDTIIPRWATSPSSPCLPPAGPCAAWPWRWGPRTSWISL